MSSPDILYAIIQLSEYNTSPTPATFHALIYLLCYIYHHLHLPLMYRSDNNENKLQYFTVKGHAEILDPEKYHGLMIYTNADFLLILAAIDPCQDI